MSYIFACGFIDTGNLYTEEGILKVATKNTLKTSKRIWRKTDDKIQI